MPFLLVGGGYTEGVGAHGQTLLLLLAYEDEVYGGADPVVLYGVGVVE